MTGRPAPLRHRAWPPAALLAVSLLVSAWVSAPWLARHAATTWPGDPGDPEQTQFFLAWLPHALAHGLDPLVTHAVLHPAGANLMWNTSVPLPALLVSPVTMLFGPTAAYGLLFALAAPATALAGYAALRRWATPTAAALGGFCFAFSPFFRGQSDGHLHLILLALVPLTLAVVDEIVVRQRWRWWLAGASLGVLAVAQLLTAEEILAADALVAVLGVAVLAGPHRHRVREATPYVVRAGGVALAVFAVLAAYPLYVQFLGPYRVHAAIHSATEFSTDLANVVVPTDQVLGGSTHHRWTGNSAEWAGYLGIPVLVVVAVLLVRRGRPAGRFAALMTTVTALLSLGPWLHVDGHVTSVPLPWLPLAHIPVIEQVLPGRLMLYAALFASLSLAVFVDAVRRIPRLATRGLGAVTALAAAASWLPTPQIATTVAAPAGFAAAAHSVRSPVALVLPIITGPTDESPQLWLAREGFPFAMPEGWVIVGSSLAEHRGPDTATYRWFSVPRGTTVPPATAREIRAEWRRWGLGAVIVAATDSARQRRLVAAVTGIAGEQPQRVGEVDVFQLVAAPAPDG